MSTARSPTAARQTRSATFCCWSRSIAGYRPRTKATASRTRCCANAARRCAPQLLLRNAGRLAHRVPARELARHVLAEGLRRRAAHDHPGRGQPFLYDLSHEAFVDDFVELGDDFPRHAARREHAVPG